MKALFLQYPKCTTCKKALKFLKDYDFAIEERHIVEDNPTETELKLWIERSGLDYKKFFNTSGQLYRQMGLKDELKDMTEMDAIKLLATNGMLVKRPLLVLENKVLVGFKEDAYKEICR
ncbi:MAG: arsenate reductase family protein [Cellulosilyticaceae bacterium]